MVGTNVWRETVVITNDGIVILDLQPQTMWLGCEYWLVIYF